MQGTNPAGSVSRMPVLFQVQNRGDVGAEIVRHLAPITTGILIKAFPIQGRIHRFSDRFAYISCDLTIGAEKQRSSFRRGEIAYMTKNSSICIFLKDTDGLSMNPIGVVKSNLELLEGIKLGEVMTINRI